nr:MAG TPA: hypothetical protein [Caudoviricetes sp.]
MTKFIKINYIGFRHNVLFPNTRKPNLKDWAPESAANITFQPYLLLTENVKLTFLKCQGFFLRYCLFYRQTTFPLHAITLRHAILLHQ